MKVDPSKIYFKPVDKEKNYAYAKSLHAKDENLKKRNIRIIIISLVALAMVPGIAYLVFRFRFENTFVSDTLPDYSQTESSSIDKDPIQITISNRQSGRINGYNTLIDFRAYYDISAVVTSVHDYFGFDFYSALVPRDICLAWGDLKDSLKDPDISYWQDSRECHIKHPNYFAEHPEEAEVGVGRSKFTSLTFSNNHLIPATREVRDQIFGLRRGDKVRIIGYLVSAYSSDTHAEHLVSSTRRDDTGDGACEVIYVARIEKYN